MAKKVWQLAPNDEVMQPGDASGGGEGYTVTVKGHVIEGMEGRGNVNINGFNVKASTNDQERLEINEVMVASELTFHGQEYLHVPNQAVYGAVFVNGVNASNQVFKLTQDTTVDLYYMTCFAKNMLVSLADGTLKTVQDITYDDDLLVWNFDEGKLDSAKPTWVKRSDYTFYYWKTDLASGKTIKTCGQFGHRFFDLESNRWVYASEIEGKTVYTLDGEDTVVTSKRIENERVDFYNIITKGHINLFGNGILLGCSLENYLYPVNDMKFVKDNRLLRPYSEFSDDVPEWWFNDCRYAESSASREYLVKYYKQRKPIALPREG